MCGRAFRSRNNPNLMTSELPAASPAMPFQSPVIDGVRDTNATGEFELIGEITARLVRRIAERDGGEDHSASSILAASPLSWEE